MDFQEQLALGIGLMADFLHTAVWSSFLFSINTESFANIINCKRKQFLVVVFFLFLGYNRIYDIITLVFSKHHKVGHNSFPNVMGLLR